ncbi:MAG: hypothetical protein LWX11_01915 [Firmicutes bacterium]|nr:hypothetical protein [Bacillota bacterium]
MTWVDWIAQHHRTFVHVPVAVALLLPWALVAAQRSGRGMRPWWVTCRFLGWAGFLFTLLTVVSGFLWARQTHHLGANQFWVSGPGQASFRWHQGLGAASLLLGAVTLRSLFRRRQEHQNIGFLGLVLGVIWSVFVLYVAYFGAKLKKPASVPITPSAPTAPVPPMAVPSSVDRLRLLDYQRLEPMHREPVRSGPHGSRWIRVWISAEAQEAYRKGAALPEGAWVVMSSQEDRWGRPGPEAGPLFAFEMKQGKPQFYLDWGRVPESKRSETGGQASVFWKADDPGLATCQACHGQGLAPLKDRSAWTGPRKAPAETLPQAGAQ